jgi:peptide/nickel transport system permease protein
MVNEAPMSQQDEKGQSRQPAPMTVISGALDEESSFSAALKRRVEAQATKERRSTWHYFSRNGLALISLIVLLLMVLAAVGAPLVTEYDPDAISYELLAPPGPEHLLGTDDVGRDVASRLIFASRISLSAGIFVALLTTALGTIVGALAGYYGGWFDSLISGVINVFLALPLLPLAMVLGSFLKTNLTFIVLILGFLLWTGVARIIRAEFLSLKEREFVIAARANGATDLRIILRHVLPNTMGVIIVAATLTMASAILAESALSFLGFGIQPPTASWGNMLQNAQRFFRVYPFLAILPGAFISLTVICINFVGDGLRDALDPRMRGRQ